MAGGPDAVRSFYDDLLPGIQRLADSELADLTAALRDETGEETLRPWDLRYYDNQLKRSRHGIDPLELAEYFPLDQVWEGLFEITGDVFGLDYREIEGAPAWHPDVRLYEIRDRSSGELLAYAYADLFPREGKFTHAAAFQLVVAHRDGEGRRQVAVSAIVANLTPPSGDRPALLRHEEVTTLFHEFGHILHMSLSQAEFVRFSGAETESDFVEAPSQIMEHWTWDADVLAPVRAALPDRRAHPAGARRAPRCGAEPQRRGQDAAPALLRPARPCAFTAKPRRPTSRPSTARPIAVTGCRSTRGRSFRPRSAT